jgi:hypothetical protein
MGAEAQVIVDIEVKCFNHNDLVYAIEIFRRQTIVRHAFVWIALKRLS